MAWTHWSSGESGAAKAAVCARTCAYRSCKAAREGTARAPLRAEIKDTWKASSSSVVALRKSLQHERAWARIVTSGTPWECQDPYHRGLHRSSTMTALASLTNHQVRLAKRPAGMPTRDDWSFTTEPVREPGEGGVLVKTLALSLDPAMRGWMNEGKSYIEPV